MGSFAHSTMTSGSLHCEVRPRSGGSMRRRTAPSRERAVARMKLAFAERAQGVGRYKGSSKEGEARMIASSWRESGESTSVHRYAATLSARACSGRNAGRLARHTSAKGCGLRYSACNRDVATYARTVRVVCVCRWELTSSFYEGWVVCAS